ncbi:MAG: ion transporter [Hydrogenophaga sp.]|jgi:voltage-gated sodium channel|uniref:ion transporter n=1 Tax=Hydrogenophaga sp. TaxID=1904254 RepID=UPI002719473C|nr:ion transporter [Hydrogenophaga sp.]MDO9570400.1 ion transporter [Hydrogenophaga sp.]MDP3372928.1 ion transporter [Hydrogenophaga sp.]
MPDSHPDSNPALRMRLGALLANARFQQFIIVLIVINAVLLGMETSGTLMAQYGSTLLALDRAILAVFVLEIAMRLYVYRAAFFRDPWSLFDFAVVGIALVPASGPFAVLRALRVLRVLRMLTMVPSMRRVVGALLSAIPGLSSIALVLLLVFYVFAVIATHLFGADFPEWFGHLGRSLYTLFQVMTLESWSMGIARPVMEIAPFSWIFFIIFILFATFTMLNLFIAIIVNAMQTFNEGEHQSTVEAVEQVGQTIEHQLHAEVQLLRQEISELKGLLRGAGGTVDANGSPVAATKLS